MRNHLTQPALAIHGRNRAEAAVRQRLGVPVHGAAFEPFRVPEETHHAMGLVAPQVSLNQRIGHDARGLAIHSKCLNAIRREATQGFMRNGPIHPGQSISCLVTLGSESPSPTVIQFDSTEAQVRHMRRSSNLDWLKCPWGRTWGIQVTSPAEALSVSRRCPCSSLQVTRAQRGLQAECQPVRVERSRLGHF